MSSIPVNGPVHGLPADSAETIDATMGKSPSSTDRLRSATRGMIALVEGSSLHMSGETRVLLQHRLRAAAIVLFSGFAAFLLRGIVMADESKPLFVVHVIITIFSGAMIWWLATQQNLSLFALRLGELAVFGGPALFFLVLSQQNLQIAANLTEGAHLPIIIVPWLLLIFIYALFIPNNWRRALLVLTPLGLAPLGVMVFQWAMCPGFKTCIVHDHYANYAFEQGMVMTLVVCTATLGVHLINQLRRTAFAAKQLGQYRLKQKLGSGGMGEVYLAEHQMMKRPCAIKLIRPDKAGDPRVLARFEREVRSTAKLSHWNSIDIYDYGNTADGTFYYVMEYLPGHNVGELVERDGPMPANRLVFLMDQLCAALAEAHGIGLVHRDIKPANIFCSYRGGEFDVAKLLDFGLAKPTIEVGDATLTQEGAITGSPLFMSPEQATGERDADARSDIYSLGAVMYYLLTGRAPFMYSQPMKVIIAHVSEDPVPPRDLMPEIPEPLEDIVMRCLEKDPEDRFQDVGDLRRALRDLVFDSPWTFERANEWWSCKGCPQRKAMAAAALEAAAV